jgi:molybdopterin-guanine dinucleotide biosynthesis protein A
MKHMSTHPSSIERQDITALVLAGGQGSRMGGCDKGLQSLHGRPLVAWVVERLLPQVGTLLISANRNCERYAEFGYPVIADDPAPSWGNSDEAALNQFSSQFSGPLAGLHAGLSQCRTPWLLSAPCDVPELPADLAARLAGAVCRQQVPLALASSAGRYHPVIALLHRDLLPDLERYLASGRRSVYGWQQSLAHAEVDFGADSFANLNTLEALRVLERG